MTPALWLQLFALSALWGGSFLFGRIAMAHLPAMSTAFARVLLAAAALWLFALATRRNPATLLPAAGALLVVGLFNNAIPFSLILWGQKEIGSGLASVINAMTPVWTLILAQIATSDEKIAPARAAGMVCGFAGVAILIGGDALDGLSASTLAQLAVLGASLSYAVAGVFARRLRGLDPVLLAAGQLTASSLLLLAPALLVDRPWELPAPPGEAVLAVVALALLCTAAAYVLFFRILAGAGAVNVSLVTFLAPVGAILLGAAFLGERFEAGQAVGVVCIAAGLAAIDGRIFARRHPAPSREGKDRG